MGSQNAENDSNLSKLRDANLGKYSIRSAKNMHSDFERFIETIVHVSSRNFQFVMREKHDFRTETTCKACANGPCKNEFCNDPQPDQSG